jgi:hypothetical protein
LGAGDFLSPALNCRDDFGARNLVTDYIPDMSASTRHGFKTSPWRGAICAGVLALFAFLAACDTASDPGLGGCGDVPPCSAYNYRVQITALEPDSTTGMYELSSSILSAYFWPDQSVPALARSATSCIPCTGSLVVDSLYFTTDLATLFQDTIRAGENLLTRSAPYPIDVSGGSLRIQGGDSRPGVFFKDSLFEIRFSGTIDSVRKSASARFRVTNPGLLFPPPYYPNPAKNQALSRRSL